MTIVKHSVASFHYTLTDNAGEILDSSKGKDPLMYIHGLGNLIPGMENELEGKKVGDKFTAKISPENGYGVFESEKVETVNRKQFGDRSLEVGMFFRTPKGVVTITKIDTDTITIDGNHPLAGKELNFDVEVMHIRDATQEEIDHGHVHSPGGHAH